MSIDPRAPFDPSDAEALATQATTVADCARDLRNKDPGQLNDDSVNPALAQIRQSQALFDYINNTNGVHPQKQDVLDSVNRAVGLVNAL
jgi:hypothetical protein